MRTCLLLVFLVAVVGSQLTTLSAAPEPEEPPCPKLKCQNNHCVTATEETMCLYEYNPQTGQMTCTGAGSC